MRRVVIDTNVLVSGILSRIGPPGRIVESLIQGTLVTLYDSRIVAEYEGVLRRPRLRLPLSMVIVLLDSIQIGGFAVAALPLPGVVLPDVTDLPFLEVAAAGAADYLITGNGPHFIPVRGRHAVTVVSPRQYVDLLDGVAERT
ncbi:MAG: putative toxin-antitoxin system toxin component, PIN family [Gemmatimonadaceae bacterium]|nr:putative toxin-antitoxin system toxin component, PIN family [Gemmatimonadaceae bacterium]